MIIEDLYREFQKSSGICTDSRNIIPGSIYFALKGDRFDGNDFAIDALKSGCRMAVADRASLACVEHVSVVDSTLQTLQDLASFHRNQKPVTLLAITGSNGKTTTKELVAVVLKKKYSLLYTQGNLNNHIGVPLTLLQISDEEIGVIEMGANHAGEIANLTKIISPDYGLITNVGKAHLEGFGSLKGVLEAKSELYLYLAKHKKPAFLNVADKLLSERAGSLELDVIPYNNETLKGKILEVYPALTCEIYSNEWYHLTTNLIGAYNLENILAAVAAGLHFGISMEDIVSAIESYRPEMHRSQLIQGKRNTIVLDAYNANPTSMRESISDFVIYTEGPKMAILGDMAELGSEEEGEHVALMEWLNTQSIDYLLLVGDAFKKAGKNFPGFKYYADVTSCIAFLREENPTGLHILIKGSRKMELESLTIHLID